MDNTDTSGLHGLGTRNDRGQHLIQFAFGQRLAIITSTFFYNNPGCKWTWIDFAPISNKTLIKNVNIINNFKFSFDYRPVRVIYIVI